MHRLQATRLARVITSRVAVRMGFGVALLAICCSSRSATSPAPDFLDAVWVGATDSFIKIDAGTRNVLERKPTQTIRAIAVDPRGTTIWAYGANQLIAYDFAGTQGVSVALPTAGIADDPGLPSPSFGRCNASALGAPGDPLVPTPHMTVNPNDGSVWVARDNQLVRVTAAGVISFTKTLTEPIVGLTVDPTRSKIWVATCYSLQKWSAAGSVENTIPVTLPTSTSLRDVAFDSSADVLWTAEADSLGKWSASGQRIFRQHYSLDVSYVAPDGTGNVWFAANSLDVHRADTNGNLLVSATPFPNPGTPTPFTLGTDPRAQIISIEANQRDHSLWAASQTYVANITTAGAVSPPLSLQDMGGAATAQIATLRTYGDFIPPDLDITSPTAGALLNTQFPQIGLAFTDIGQDVDNSSVSISTGAGTVSVQCTFTSNGAACTPSQAIPEGPVTLNATVADFAGNVSAASHVSFSIDVTPPAIFVTSPIEGLATNQSSVVIQGNVSEASSFTINGTAQPLGNGNSFNYTASLVEGSNLFVLEATDATGNVGSLNLHVTKDTINPAIPDTTLITLGAPIDGQVTVAGAAGSVEPGARVTLRNKRTGQSVTVTAAQDGSFVGILAGVAGDDFEIKQQDAASNTSGSITKTVVPANPASVASALSATDITSFIDSNSFLYGGANPIQTGVGTGTIDPIRAAVLRGRVIGIDGNAIPGVTITVLNHSEFGQTVSRLDGMFDMVVNGGGPLVVTYRRAGFPPLQRQIDVKWQDYNVLPDVILTPLDSQVTAIDLSASGMQVAQSSVQSDADGSRQATVLIPQGTQATITLPDGSQQALSSLHVRATEYTVGSRGPKAMPGDLSTASGYTYAVELSTDEAIANGVKVAGKDVQFNQPVPVLIDNFLNFPVGGIAPLGYYDADKGAWIPYGNGRVIKLLSVDAQGRGQLDISGSGSPADSTALAALGITDDERTQIASLYAIGKTLWRLSLTHFSTWDANWPFGFPATAIAPPAQPQSIALNTNQGDTCHGCAIGAQEQTLGEEIPVTGTPYSLHYTTERQPGDKPAFSTIIPVTGASIPASLKRIDLTVAIAGQTFTRTFTPATNLQQTFTWDGKDAYGRKVQGQRSAKISVSFVYSPVYYAPASFATQAFAVASANPGTQVGHDRGAGEVSSIRNWTQTLGIYEADGDKLGGWTLSSHQLYDINAQVLYSGDGSHRSADAVARVIRTVAGPVNASQFPDNVPATNANLNEGYGLAVAQDGTVYFAETTQNVIRKVGRDGIIHRIAGIENTAGFSGDEGPATSAKLSNPYGVALGSDGSLYIADFGNNRIRKITPDGVIHTIAGTGAAAFSGDNGLATQAAIANPWGIAVAPDGSIYFSDYGNNRIRKIGPDGIIHTFAGTGAYGYTGDGGAATAATFGQAGYNIGPMNIALGPDGSLYIAEYMNSAIRRVAPTNGRISTFAGGFNGFWGGFSGDGGPATSAYLSGPHGMAVDRNNNVYIADRYNGRIRMVTQDGIIRTIAGNGANPATTADGEGVPPTKSVVAAPEHIQIGPDDSLYYVDVGAGHHKVRRIEVGMPKFQNANVDVVSPDASSVYRFNSSGRQLSTLDAFTNTTVEGFSYDGAGRLTGITDVDGDTTVIERDGTGTATGIVSPDGQRTTLTMDANGYLATVTNPAGDIYQMGYDATGMLGMFEDPNQHQSTYTYDPTTGRLATDTNAAGGGWTLGRADLPGSYTRTMTSAESRVGTFAASTTASRDRLLTNTASDGTVETVSYKENADAVATAADGSITTQSPTGDPRFWLQAPVVSTTVQMPSGLTRTTTVTRSDTLSDYNNIFSLTAWSETTALNGKNYVRSYAPSTKTWTLSSPVNRQTVITLNSKARPATSKFANLETTAYAYTPEGRVDYMTTGSGGSARTTDFTYYASGPSKGLLQSVTDAEQRTVSYEYDLSGRVTKQTLPDSRFVLYSYDAGGNLASITPPGRDAHVFHYTSVDLQQDYTPPAAANTGTNVTTYSYNLDKDLDLITRPDGQTVDFIYNGPGKKLSDITIPTGTYSYGYHATKGYLTSISAPGGQNLAFAFDGFLPTSETSSGVVAGTVAWGYNSDLRVNSQSVNGSALSFGYDNDGLLTTAGAETLVRNTNPNNGLLASTTLGSVTTAHTYSTFGEPAADSAAFNGTTLYSASYTTRDNLGRIRAKTETVQGVTHNYAYSYDAAGRLDTVTIDGTLVSDYDYDTNGNRTSAHSPTPIATYDAQDRLLTYGNATYTYTPNGELLTKTVSGNTTTYGFDVLGNLRTVALPGNVSIEYVIDGRNRRVGKKVNGTLTQGFLYGNQLKPVAELDGSGNLVSRFVYGSKAQVPDYMVRAGVTYRIVSDYLGSPRLVVNTSTGAVVQQMDFDEFGNVTNDTNPGFQPFGFAGGTFDRDTLLTRFGARDYDAATGRWTAKDPIGFTGRSTNFFSYSLNDPLNCFDENGKIVGWIAGAVLVGIGLKALWDYIHEGEAKHEEIQAQFEGKTMEEFGRNYSNNFTRSNEAFSSIGRKGIEFGLACPGTSAMGPFPTSEATDLVTEAGKAIVMDRALKNGEETAEERWK